MCFSLSFNPTLRKKEEEKHAYSCQQNKARLFLFLVKDTSKNISIFFICFLFLNVMAAAPVLVLGQVDESARGPTPFSHWG
jgi:hypothetical protein